MFKLSVISTLATSAVNANDVEAEGRHHGGHGPIGLAHGGLGPVGLPHGGLGPYDGPHGGLHGGLGPYDGPHGELGLIGGPGPYDGPHGGLHGPHGHGPLVVGPAPGLKSSRRLGKIDNYHGGPLGAPLGGPLGAPLGGPLGGSLGGHLGKPIGGHLGKPLGGHLGKPLGGHLGKPLGGPLGKPVGRPLGKPVGRHLGKPIGLPLGKPLGPPLAKKIGGLDVHRRGIRKDLDLSLDTIRGHHASKGYGGAYRSRPKKVRLSKKSIRAPYGGPGPIPGPLGPGPLGLRPHKQGPCPGPLCLSRRGRYDAPRRGGPLPYGAPKKIVKSPHRGLPYGGPKRSIRGGPLLAPRRGGYGVPNGPHPFGRHGRVVPVGRFDGPGRHALVHPRGHRGNKLSAEDRAMLDKADELLFTYDRKPLIPKYDEKDAPEVPVHKEPVVEEPAEVEAEPKAEVEAAEEVADEVIVVDEAEEEDAEEEDAEEPEEVEADEAVTVESGSTDENIHNELLEAKVEVEEQLKEDLERDDEIAEASEVNDMMAKD